MESAPVLLPSPRKSAFQTPYTHEIHNTSSEEEEDHYSYDPSPDEAVFDDDSQGDSHEASSPHTSDDDLSTIPPDPDSRAPSTIYTPHKRRSPFRHPSSVRNLQLETTPPHLVSPQHRAYHLTTTNASRNATPQSHYSSGSRPHSSRSSPTKKPKQKAKKEHPLVLLHLTLLPLTLPYPQSLLETTLPAKKLADCKLLKEKLSASVIQERGVLIPHPRDDYELLEERLLEALELEQGVLSRDGHFVIPEERTISRAGSRSIARTRYSSVDSLLEEDEEEGGEQDDDDTKTETAESPICHDCGKEIDLIGSDRRWDIRVYAANGLMREGAWSAAWKEMERVDVEIRPFISDDTKRRLEDQWEEMELLMSASSKQQALPPSSDEIVYESIEEPDTHAAPMRTPTPEEEQRPRLSTERLKEIYGEQADAKIESLKEESVFEHPIERSPSPGKQVRPAEIPLATLLLNYLQVLLQDRRNVAIICLSSVVVFMAAQITQATRADNSVLQETAPALVASSMSSMPAQLSPSTPVASASVASISEIVSTVTEVRYISISAPEPSPSSSVHDVVSKQIPSSSADETTAIETEEALHTIEPPQIASVNIEAETSHQEPDMTFPDLQLTDESVEEVPDSTDPTGSPFEEYERELTVTAIQDKVQPVVEDTHLDAWSQEMEL